MRRHAFSPVRRHTFSLVRLAMRTARTDCLSRLSSFCRQETVGTAPHRNGTVGIETKPGGEESQGDQNIANSKSEVRREEKNW